MKKSLAIFFILFFSFIFVQIAESQNGINVPGGTGNYLSIPSTSNNSFSGSTSITVEAWVYLTSSARGGAIICKGEGGGGESYCLDVYWLGDQNSSNARARFFVRDNSTKNALVVESSVGFTYNEWHHIAGVYDGSKITIYYDGLKTEVTGNVPNGILGNDHALTIGARQSGSTTYDYYVQGMIEEVRIWNTARTEAQIIDNMLNEIPNSMYPSGLVAYYKLGTLDDEISNNDGSLVGTFGSSIYSNSAFRSLFTTSTAGAWNTNSNWLYSWSPNSLAPALRKYVNAEIANNMTLGSDQNINGLTLNGGNINTGSYVLTVGRSVSNIGDVSINSGYVIGSFRRWISQTNPKSYDFPVGGTNYYRPVSITYTVPPTSGGTLTVKHFETNPLSNNTTAISDGEYSINVFSKDLYWDITNSGVSGSTYNLTLNAPFITGLGNTDTKRSKVRILKRDGSTSNWAVQGDHSAASTISSGNGVIAFRDNLSTFSQFGLGSNDQDNPFEGALPISLSTFNYSVIGKDIKLNWSTSEEINNSGFDVERKSVSSDWQKVGFVRGNNKPSQYEFTERNLTTGKYQYRLKQIDFNGNFEYHNLDGYVEVGIPAKFDLSQNYPNPFNPVTNISYQVASSGVVKITVYDMLGKEVKTLVNEFKEPGYYNMNFDAGNLNSGIYFYRMNAGDFSNVKKLVLIK